MIINEHEILECLLGCRRQLGQWADCLESDEGNEEQVKEVDELLNQLNVFIKMSKDGTRVSDTQ